MYSTRNATFGILSDILSQLDDYDIFAYYMGNFTVGKLYNSPLRQDDKNPSFAVFRGRQGNLMFKDHGSGIAGNALKFVKEYNHISTDSELEKELLKIIRHTAPLSTRDVKKEYKSNSTIEIGIVRQEFTDADIKYWGQYNIDVPTLKYFKVFSIKYFLCNRVVSGVYKDTNPMFAYKVNDRFKIYRPMNSKYTKWRTNLTSRDIQGLEQLPDGKRKLLIITKSLKDVMVLSEQMLILYDRDKTGMMRAREYSKKYNIPAFFINKKFAAKDISDAVKENGFDTINEWLTKTLSKYV